LLVTRASRRDHDEIRAFYAEQEWDDVKDGTFFIARRGPIIGALCLITLEPDVTLVEDVLVHRDHRGVGIGARLVEAAMNNKGGTMYLCCHDERIDFYERLGFRKIDQNDLPASAQSFWREDGALKEEYEPDHVHHFMRAR
jgi:N-acetylglutamate synthase-like GNAT family acetyltransferase